MKGKHEEKSLIMLVVSLSLYSFDTSFQVNERKRIGTSHRSILSKISEQADLRRKQVVMLTLSISVNSLDRRCRSMRNKQKKRRRSRENEREKKEYWS